MKYKVATLGCKVNQVETQALEAMLRSRGFSLAQEGEVPELIIINTCAVTAESGRKSRQTIRKLMGEYPESVIAVCGCYSQLEPEQVQALGATVVHGSGDKARFAEDIIKALDEKQRISFNDAPFERRVMEELCGGAVDGRTRAMLKIQDGCVNFCTYCIIPYTRGRVRSLPPERCAAQAAALAAAGYRELVITGIEIASYGKDLGGGLCLADAIEAIAGESAGMRLRLGSLEPTVITEEFCRRLAATGKLCGHFHLSLQSGCDEILKRMNRKYDTERFWRSCELLREYFPDCALTADLIVGFPGETPEHHAETLAFIEKCGFSSMHIFPYSIRPGTQAAEMEGQLTSAEKSRRAAEASALAERMEETYLHSCVGKKLDVLFETEREGVSVGHAGNYTQVCVSEELLHGVVKSVQIVDVLDKMLVGLII